MNASRSTRRTLAASALATFSVLFAAQAIAQPYPEPATASSDVSVISTGSEADVLGAPDDAAQGVDQCPTDVGLLVADLLLAGLDARAANYAVYAITDDCGESTH
jgi:hypothetical protein